MKNLSSGEANNIELEYKIHPEGRSHMKEQYMDTEKASAILQERDYVKRDAMIDALTEEEAKVFCKFLLEILPRRGAPKVRVRTIS